MEPIVEWYVWSHGIFTIPVIFSISYLLQFTVGCPGPCMCFPLHLHLQMSSLKFVEYLGVVGLEPWMVATFSEIALDLVENRIDLKVVKYTFESSLGSLIVMNTLVATDWLWLRFDPVYRVV